MYKMAFPYNYIWEYPGFYSLTVTYGVYNTFYFSQFLALGVINFCEFRVHQRYFLAYLQLTTVFLLSAMLIFCRGHYFIDIFGGLLLGHYLWMWAERRAWLIDWALFKIPFVLRYPCFESVCGLCKEPINQWAVQRRDTLMTGPGVNASRREDGEVLEEPLNKDGVNFTGGTKGDRFD